MGSYCDVIGVRSFAKFNDKAEDYEERVLEQFIRHSGRPVFSMEAATRHPLQSFADLITIEEYKTKERPKVVMTWAPHPNALPQAVPNSFAEWMNAADYDFVITHPEGYELAPQFVGRARVEYDERKALEGADFVYAKNWAAYADPNYGKVLCRDRAWTVDAEKMALTDNAFFMHCLPVRRNMIVTDEVIESPRSLVIPEAANREISAQVVLEKIAGGTRIMEKITVVKIGGNVIDDPAVLKRFIADFAAMPGPKILVHGGGKVATRLAERLELKVQMVDGRRITDKGTLDVVTMVYAGLVNKQLVASLQAEGCNALGMSGADGNAVTARRRAPQPIDYGFVGDIEKVDSRLLGRLLEAGVTPVFCAIMHDGQGTLLNCNADSVASAIALGAAQIAPAELVFCFEKSGVLRDPDDETTLIREITAGSYAALKAEGVVSKGMIPEDPRTPSRPSQTAFGASRSNIPTTCQTTREQSSDNPRFRQSARTAGAEKDGRAWMQKRRKRSNCSGGSSQRLRPRATKAARPTCCSPFLRSAARRPNGCTTTSSPAPRTSTRRAPPSC